jgi:uncharacterized protein (TIGR02996 family)
MDDAAFLQGVVAAPEDNALRLVYADWLEEQGDPRAEYLRCQCARAGIRPQDPHLAVLLRREAELRRQYPDLIVPWQRRLTLSRIHYLLRRAGPDGDRAGSGAVQSSPYTARPRLTEEELAAWETEYRVTVPEEYRLFLQEVGDGGTMPGSYCDFVMQPLAQVRGSENASTAFPVTAERLRRRFRQLESEGRPSDGILFPELTAYWEKHDQPPPGCVVFGQYPSSDTLFLVTSGELRGSVWCAVGWGIPERDRAGEPLGFLAWFEDALAEFLETGA